MPTRTAVWPFELFSDPRPNERGPNQLRCFLISPFTPKEACDDLTRIVRDACNSVGTNLYCTLECVRADDIGGSGVIHADIWHEIQTADVIIADVTGRNGNVLLELGVAAAIRHKEHVVVLMEEGEDQRFLFDLGPVRHILYQRTYQGFTKLLTDLRYALLLALTTAPTMASTEAAIPAHLRADFTAIRDVDWLIGPSLTHRRSTAGGLEYGSLFVYRNSWLRFRGEYANIDLTAQLAFAQLRDQPAWIGIGVRSQNCFANWSNLIYVRSDGTVVITVIENDLGAYHDEELGRISNFAPNQTLTFRIQIDAKEFTRSINEIGCTRPLTKLPHVFPAGMVLLQTYNARALIMNIDLRRIS